VYSSIEETGEYQREVGDGLRECGARVRGDDGAFIGRGGGRFRRLIGGRTGSRGDFSLISARTKKIYIIIVTIIIILLYIAEHIYIIIRGV
jgi:hypothetical protein